MLRRLPLRSPEASTAVAALRRLFSRQPKPPLPPTATAAPTAAAAAPSAAAVDAIYHILTTSPTEDAMAAALHSTPIPLTPALTDAVLARARFAHANPLRALHFFTLASSSSPPSPSSHDTLIYILGRSRHFPRAFRLLKHTRRTHPDLITPRTLNILLARVAKVCSLRQTLASFHRFRNLLTPFTTACFNALLRTLTQEKSMDDARHAYRSLKHEFRPDTNTFNILLSGWKSVEDAELFFKEMQDLGVSPDLITFNCLIDVYCKNRQVQKGYKLLDEMREKEIYPDVITYTSLIGGLGLVGQPDKGRDVLKEMREFGVYPDVPAYNATIRNFCIAKRMRDAFALMEEMAGRGLAPNPTSYNLFFRCFYWANNLAGAWDLYRRMRGEGCLPNTQSCMFLVRLFKRQEKVGMAMEFWNDMVEKEFGSFTLVSDVLFDLLCNNGKLEEAERCFYQMIDKGQKPSYVSFRRILVLMRLAKRDESIKQMSEKMSVFGDLPQIEEIEE